MPRRNKRVVYEQQEITLEMLNNEVAVNLECEDCPFASHGFICSASDGSCLRNGYKKPKRKEEENAVTQR